VIFFGVVSSQTEKALELFLERERAEAFIAEVEQDEPETAALLRVEPVELGLSDRFSLGRRHFRISNSSTPRQSFFSPRMRGVEPRRLSPAQSESRAAASRPSART
jgi:hypothetical protein